MPNSSYKLILVKMRAEYGRFFGGTAGVVWARIRANSSCCDFFYFCDLVHVRGVVDPFAEQLVVPAQNRQNAGGITDVRAIFQKCPYIQAYPYKYRRLGHTAILSLSSGLGLKPYHQAWLKTWSSDTIHGI